MGTYRKYIVILVSLLIGVGIFFWIYNAYLYNDDPLDYDQLEIANLKIDENGFFSGKFNCNINGKDISKYDYEVEDNYLYITVYASSSGEKVMAADSKGNVRIKFYAGKDIKKVYYRTFEKDTYMNVTKES